MKNIIIYLLFFFSICSTLLFSQNIWELKFSNSDDLPKYLICPDSNHIYLGTANSTNFGQTFLYLSSNQGNNWSIINTFDSVYFKNISCPNSSNIWLGFERGFTFNSTNGGESFNLKSIADVKSYERIEMYDNDVGIITNVYIVPDTFFLLITKDSWKTYKKFSFQNDSNRFRYTFPKFKNDSIVTCLVGNSRGRKGGYFLELNINTLQYKLNWIGTNYGSADITYLDNNIFVCGWSNSISGGSSHDAILKSTDGGKTWRTILDLYTADTKFYTNSNKILPFGLQSISFKDSLSGIAVGQGGKIVYTYDGGDSWIYENKLPDSIYQTPTMLVRYAGSVPIIATFDGHIYRLVEDNLAPKAEDTITISGRVWEGDKGQPGIPVVLGYRVTMTDSNGYYKFTRVAKGNYVIHAENKYFDGDNPSYYYRPFRYVPEYYELDLTSDTSGIDFNAIDLRTFYSVSGEIITTNGEGLKDIPLTIGDSSTISIEDGKFIFPRIEYHRTFDLILYSKEYTFTPEKYTINIDNDLDTFRFVASPVTSVSEPLSKVGKINIIPNPANNYIDIEFETDIFSSNFHIYNLMGIDVITGIIPAYTKQHRINIECLPVGTYFIKIGDKVARFVKM